MCPDLLPYVIGLRQVDQVNDGLGCEQLVVVEQLSIPGAPFAKPEDAGAMGFKSLYSPEKLLMGLRAQT